jgi:hypothetical protein
MIKTKPKNDDLPKINEAEAANFAKAANVTNQPQETVKKEKVKKVNTEGNTTAILLNFPEATELMAHIEQLPLQRGRKVSRHAWIVDAIYEKWEREKKKK